MRQEGYFKLKTEDFFERRWQPLGEIRCHLVLLHGYGEHCARYEHTANTLNAGGIMVHSFDQRGFGRSPGKRAYIRKFDVLLDDLDAYLAHVRPRFEDKPWFMMGHSMGGMVLAAYAETRPLDARGLVFSSPFLALNDDVPKLLLSVAGILGKIAPWLPVAGVDNQGLSRDPAIVKAADNDPLGYHGWVKARTGAQFHTAIARIQAHFPAIDLPLYIIHGGDDRIVPNIGSRRLHEQCSSPDKSLKIYDGGYHELWNDIVKEEVIAGIREWILARIP
jgi:alpha-beta hydrolase superfamily lysophospholipase